MDTRAKLKEAFKELRKDNYMARMNFLCCGNCASCAMFQEGKKKADKGNKSNGFVFWTHQDEQDLNNNGFVYLGFGGNEPDDVTPDFLKSTEEVAKAIVEKLEKHGVNFEWDGDPGIKILVKDE